MNHSLRNIKLIIEYDGTLYHGWQYQTNALTIQRVIEDKLSLITNENISLIASGRTDAGVHALAQVANFRTTSKVPLDAFIKGLNSLLPPDIIIKEAAVVKENFDARRSAKSKIYLFIIFNTSAPSVFYRNHSWFVPFELDMDLMRSAGFFLIGRHDFSSFQSSNNDSAHPIRELMNLSLDKKENRFIHINVEGNGFLKYMVRNIVGTLVDVGRKKITVDKFKAIFEAGDRTLAGITAPSRGLFLKEVKY